MKEEILDNKLIEFYVVHIYDELIKDLTIVNCNDHQCDDEDCVLYRAVKQYIKYNNVKLKINDEQN